MSKKKKYHVFSDDNLEYIIKVKKNKKGTHYKMYRSKGDQWVDRVKGELVEYWLDHGNGFEGLDIDDRQTDYDRLGTIKIMFDFIKKYDDNLFMKHKITKPKQR